VLEFALLGLLKERPMHGYDLRKRLREEFGPLQNLSFGSVYPALGRLESTGEIRAVTSTPSAEAPIAFTGSLGGERAATVARRAGLVAGVLGGRGTRARKVYEITSRGEELFERLLETPGRNDGSGEFALRLAFARHLSPPARIRVLERQLAELAGRFERASRSVEEPGRPLDVYERSLAEHARDTVAGELSWVERLLAEERQRQAPGRPAEAGKGTRASRARRTDEPIPVTAGAGTTEKGTDR